MNIFQRDRVGQSAATTGRKRAVWLDELVGNTPLVELDNIARREQLSPSVRLLAKAEWFNPSGSVKDRPALSIIREAEKKGQLGPGITLLDATSGNMGIAYATLAAPRGYPVWLTLPESASPERIAILKRLGVKLELTDALEGSDGATIRARSLAAEHGQDLFYADQYNNDANWQAHYKGTANEIWQQSGGQITHFVAGMGTSGTFTGTTRRLRELNPAIRCLSMQPSTPLHGVEGLKHMPTALVPGIYDSSLADGNLVVDTEAAYDQANALARYEGLFVGVSSGAAVAAAVEVARGLSSGVVVTVLPDAGFKYLSDDAWPVAEARSNDDSNR